MNLKNFPKRLDSKTSCLRISVPENLDLALEGLIRKVLREQPKTDDIYTFAAEYFEALLQIRDKTGAKLAADELCLFHNDEDAHEMIKLAGTFPKPPPKNVRAKPEHSRRKTKPGGNVVVGENSKKGSKKKKPVELLKQTTPDLIKKLPTVPEKEKKEEVEENEEYLTSDPIKELVEKELMEADLKKKTEIVGNVQEDSKKMNESVKSADRKDEGTEKAVKEKEALIPKQGAVSLIKEALVQKVESTNAEEPPVLKETTISTAEIPVSTQEEEKDTQITEETNTQELQTEPKVTEDIQNTEEQTNSPELTKLSPTTQQQTNEPEKTKSEHLDTSVEESVTSTPDVQQRTAEQLETKPESTQINTEVDTNQKVQETVPEPESTSNSNENSNEGDKIENEMNSESVKEAQQEETAPETPLVDDKSEEEIKPQNTEEIPVVEETETKEKEEKVEGRNNELEIQQKESEVKEKYDKVIEEVKKVVTEEDTDGKDVKVVDEGNKVLKVTEEEQKVVEKTKQLLEKVEKEHREEEKDVKEEDEVVEEGDKILKKEQKLVEGDNAQKEEQKVVEEVEKVQNGKEQNIVEEVDETQKGVEEGDKAQKEKQKVQEEDKAQNKEQRAVEGDKALEEDQKVVTGDEDLKEEHSVVEILEKVMEEHRISENTEEVVQQVENVLEKKNKNFKKENKHPEEENKNLKKENKHPEEENQGITEDDKILLGREHEVVEEPEKVIQNDILEKEHKSDENGETPGTEDQEESDKALEKEDKIVEEPSEDKETPERTIEEGDKIVLVQDKVMETSGHIIEEGDRVMPTEEKLVEEDTNGSEKQNKNLMECRNLETEGPLLSEPLENPDELCTVVDIGRIPEQNKANEEMQDNSESKGTSDPEELCTVVDIDHVPKENNNNQETQGQLEPTHPKDPEEVCSVVDTDHIPTKQTPEEKTDLIPEKHPETDQHTPNKEPTEKPSAVPDTDHIITVEEVDTTSSEIGEVQIKTIQAHYDTLQVPERVTKEYRVHRVATPIPETLPAPTPHASSAETGVAPSTSTPSQHDTQKSESDALLLTPSSGYSLNLSELSYQAVSDLFLNSERRCSSTEKEIPRHENVKKTVVHSIVKAVPLSPRATQELNEESVLQTSKKPKDCSDTLGSSNGRSEDDDILFISVEVKTVIETQTLDEEDSQAPEVEVQVETRIDTQNDAGTQAYPVEEAEASHGESQEKVDLKPGSERDVRRESDSTETSGKDNSTGDSDSISSAVTEIKRTGSGKRNLGSTKGLLATQSLDFGKRNPLVKTRSLSSFRHGVTDFEVWSTIEKELEDAATKIQSKFRGYKTRKKLQRENAVQITTEESSPTTTPVETEPREVFQQSTGEFHDSIVLSDHPR